MSGDSRTGLVEEAQSLAALGDRVGAIGRLRQLAESTAPNPELLIPGAFGAFQLGEPALAEHMLRRAIALGPGLAPAYLNLGNVLQAQGRLREAVSSFKQALEIAPGDTVALGNLGGALEQIGQPDQAEEVYRQALGYKPDDAALGCALGRAVEKQARLDEALAIYGEILESSPDFVPAHTSIGTLLQKAKRQDDAEAAYRRALDIDPAHSPARQNLAVLLQEMGNLRDAETHLRQVITDLPDDPLPHVNLARVLYDSRNFHGAVDECDLALQLHPGNGLALALKAACLAEAGDAEGALFLTDMERLVTRTEPLVPGVYATPDAFNSALFDQVASLPDRFSEPGTDLARQTCDLMIDPTGPLDIFRAMITDAVSRYIEEISGLRHPFAAIAPQHWRLESWATILREIKPGEDTHNHQTAWLSGVYYARVPSEIDPASDSSGWIEFGRPPHNIRHSVEPTITVFPPRQGMLILFPAYFYHRVLPFTAAQHRMSIAFDVIPT